LLAAPALLCTPTHVFLEWLPLYWHACTWLQAVDTMPSQMQGAAGGELAALQNIQAPLGLFLMLRCHVCESRQQCLLVLSAAWRFAAVALTLGALQSLRSAVLQSVVACFAMHCSCLSIGGVTPSDHHDGNQHNCLEYGAAVVATGCWLASSCHGNSHLSYIGNLARLGSQWQAHWARKQVQAHKSRKEK
jgi:hypothetical protein